MTEQHLAFCVATAGQNLLKQIILDRKDIFENISGYGPV
jgi:hypothetical protein